MIIELERIASELREAADLSQHPEIFYSLAERLDRIIEQMNGKALEQVAEDEEGA